MALVIQQHSIASSSSLSSLFISENHLSRKHPPKELHHQNIKKHCSCFQPKASWQELAGVLILSAIPFTAVKGIANSPLGEKLQKRALEQKLTAVQLSVERSKLAQIARNQSFEILHARWAMLGALGALIPEILDLSGLCLGRLVL